MTHCLACGSALPAGLQVCRACGAAVPLVASAPVHRPRGGDRRASARTAAAPAHGINTWTLVLGIAGGLLVFGTISFLLLMGMPFHFGRGATTHSATVEKTESVEPIAEGAPPPTSPDLGVAPPQPPPVATFDPLSTTAAAAPIPITPPLPEPRPVVRSNIKIGGGGLFSTADENGADARQTAPRLMAESEALDVLIPIASPFYRETPSNCVRFRALGYFNDGYTIDARDDCNNQPLGRWRVDARTRQVLHLDSDGTYRRP